MAFLLGDIAANKGQAPDRWYAVRVCHKKHPHKSIGAAQAHIRAMVKLPDYDGVELAPYRCTICRLWHVRRVHKIQ